MTEKTAQLLADALDAISDQLASIEKGKGEKWLHQTCETIAEAVCAIRAEAELYPPKNYGPVATADSSKDEQNRN